MVKSVNGDLLFRLAAVCIIQGLVLAPAILNLLDAEGIFEVLPLAL